MKNPFHTTWPHNNSMFRAHVILTLGTGHLIVLIIHLYHPFSFIPVILHVTLRVINLSFLSVGFDGH
jgi:hypothetical protein